MEWYHVCWPRLTAKRVEPVDSISWASCFMARLRDVMANRISVLPSVCRSVRPKSVLCLNECKYRHNFWRSGNGLIVVCFSGPNAFTIFQLEPLRGYVKYTWVGKILHLSLLSQKRYEIGPWLLWIANRKSWVTHRFVSVPMTLCDLKKRDARGQFFSGGSS